MVTKTLSSPHITGLLDRLFEETQANRPALETLTQSDPQRLLTSKTAYREFYGSRIITTEFEASKAERAREHLTEAGLIDLVEIREGDALQTLEHAIPTRLDLVLLDGAKALYGEILSLIEPFLGPGSLILADDSQHCGEFVSQMRADESRYISVPLSQDLEISMRL
jgi:predicted O-methyltransferase YrrM